MAKSKNIIYLSFKNKNKAEEWLKDHGVDCKFYDSRLIYVDVNFEKGKFYDNQQGETQENKIARN